MDFILFVLGVMLAWPAATGFVLAMLLLWAVLHIMKRVEGPTPDYDDSENGVGRPL